MKHRFTTKSRRGRGHISKAVRRGVYRRDGFTCKYCRERFHPTKLTIDHLVPLDRGGLDEVRNYVSCCQDCNQKKANLSLATFAKSINVELDELPVHGDPVIDNEDLPIQIRQLRRMLFDQYRQGDLRLSGSGAQRKLEKKYRRLFWETNEGKALEQAFPRLPGQVRIMIPEIKTIARNAREFWLLVELAKSAKTRNLIGHQFVKGCDIELRFREMIAKTRDAGLRKRMNHALTRFENRVRS